MLVHDLLANDLPTSVVATPAPAVEERYGWHGLATTLLGTLTSARPGRGD